MREEIWNCFLLLTSRYWLYFPLTLRTLRTLQEEAALLIAIKDAMGTAEVTS